MPWYEIGISAPSSDYRVEAENETEATLKADRLFSADVESGLFTYRVREVDEDV